MTKTFGISVDFLRCVLWAYLDQHFELNAAQQSGSRENHVEDLSS